MLQVYSLLIVCEFVLYMQVLQPLQHPVIVLPGTNFTDLCALVTFMYSGEVNIYQEQLPGLLNMADAMQIRGLAEVNGVRIYFNEKHLTYKFGLAIKLRYYVKVQMFLRT